MCRLLLAPSLDQGPESVPSCHICSRRWVICGSGLIRGEDLVTQGCLASPRESWLILPNSLFQLHPSSQSWDPSPVCKVSGSNHPEALPEGYCSSGGRRGLRQNCPVPGSQACKSGCGLFEVLQKNGRKGHQGHGVSPLCQVLYTHLRGSIPHQPDPGLLQPPLQASLEPVVTS